MPNVPVLDASAAVDLVLRRPDRGTWVAEQVLGGAPLHSSHLIDVEVVSALRRFALSGALSIPRAEEGLELFQQLGIQRHALHDLLSRIWSLRNSLTAYDASYVALAEALDAPLLTTDDRLARSTGHRAAITAFPG